MKLTSYLACGVILASLTSGAWAGVKHGPRGQQPVVGGFQAPKGPQTHRVEGKQFQLSKNYKNHFKGRFFEFKKHEVKKNIDATTPQIVAGLYERFLEQGQGGEVDATPLNTRSNVAGRKAHRVDFSRQRVEEFKFFRVDEQRRPEGSTPPVHSAPGTPPSAPGAPATPPTTSTGTTSTPGGWNRVRNPSDTTTAPISYNTTTNASD